jgi:precorrin-2/cobalt-factor-2 C20-methyltransferase
MAGILYGIGVGPGDPELLTLKAQKTIESVACLAVPKAAEEGDSLALAIVKPWLPAGQPRIELFFPMTRDEGALRSCREKAAGLLMEQLAQGSDVGFITLGDPTLYSTYMYIHRLVTGEGFEARIIPGVPAMCAASAGTGVSLAEGDENLAVLSSCQNRDQLEKAVSDFDNIVLMKISRNYPVIRSVLAEKGLWAKAVMVSRCGLEGQFAKAGPEAELLEKPDYFTTLLIKKNGVRK